MAPVDMLAVAENGGREGDAAHERGLLPSMDHLAPVRAQEGTFTCVMKPADGLLQGTVYSDGSGVGGPIPSLTRLGWAFCSVNAGGQVTSKAYGTCPNWIDDVPGAEAWGLLQAAQLAMPGTSYRVDCLPCVQSIHRGRNWATFDTRVHARVNLRLHTALGDTDASLVVWMPAHTSVADVGVKLLGDGSKLSEGDRMANAVADYWAKYAAGTVKVAPEIVATVKTQEKRAEAAARWFVYATWAANHQRKAPKRNTEASRASARAANIAVGSKAKCTTRWKELVEQRPVALGGHCLTRSANAWHCTTCKRWSKAWNTIAPQLCTGSVAVRWAKMQAIWLPKGLTMEAGIRKPYRAMSCGARHAVHMLRCRRKVWPSHA